jgi:DNA topoisomerase-1
MSYDLLIIESPNKRKKLASLLPDTFRIEASVGHIRDLPPRALGVDLNTFVATYEYSDRGEDVVKKLRSLAKGARNVYLGTDPDREGEAIAWHLKEALNLTNPYRVKFQELTKAAVTKSMQSPGKIDDNLVDAQQARRVLDRLVGWKASSRISDAVGTKASAGRVQTPSVVMIVDRENAIRNFVSVPHFGVELTFDGPNGKWTADWNFKPFLPKGETLWLDGATAAGVANIRDVAVVGVEDAPAYRKPPGAFTTDTLLQAAFNSRELRMSAEQTMDAAQALFQDGHITYHRTDSPNLSLEAIEEIRALAKQRGWKVPDEPRRFKVGADAQEGHEAIRPTHLDVDEAGATDQQRALYRLIRERAIASQLADAEYSVRTVLLKSIVEIAGRNLDFRGTGRTLTSPGWLALTASDLAEEEDDDGPKVPDNPVPIIAAGTPLRALAGEMKSKHTQPPAYFTEASLVGELKKNGVGRPSTYKSIVSTIKDRGYVTQDQKRKLRPTTLAETMVREVKGKFSFADPTFTAAMEAQLDKIAGGTQQYAPVVRAMNTVLDAELSRLPVVERPKPTGPECPVCHKGVLTARPGKYGQWHGCTAYPECTAKYPDKNGQPDYTPRVAQERDPSWPDCPEGCGGYLVPREGAKGRFWGCSSYKSGKCKAIFDDAGGKPNFDRSQRALPKGVTANSDGTVNIRIANFDSRGGSGRKGGSRKKSSKKW